MKKAFLPSLLLFALLCFSSCKKEKTIDYEAMLLGTWHFSHSTLNGMKSASFENDAAHYYRFSSDGTYHFKNEYSYVSEHDGNWEWQPVDSTLLLQAHSTEYDISYNYSDELKVYKISPSELHFGYRFFTNGQWNRQIDVYVQR